MLEVRIEDRIGALELRVDAQLGAGAIALYGPSGAGKSTLLHTIAGLRRPRAGRIVLDGRVLLDRDAGVDVPPHLRRVAVVFQDGRLFPHRSVQGNLRYGLRHGRRGEPREGEGPNFDEVVALLKLEPLLTRRPRGLSGGERQRVTLGRALLSAPRLLLLDEPLVGLDPALRGTVLRYLRRVREAFAVPMIYVSHDLSEVLALTDEMLLIEAGQITGQGHWAELALDARLAGERLSRLTVEAVRAGEGGAWLELVGGQRLWTAHPVMEGAQVLIRARDVVLSLAGPEAVALGNRLQGTIRRVVRAGDRARVSVDVGQVLVVDVPSSAAQTMALKVGMPIACLVDPLRVRTV